MEKGWCPRWLWRAAKNLVNLVVCFVMMLTRSVGAWIQGIVTSDRYSVYGRLKLGQRHVCRAHLKRDFQELVDRGGEEKAIGKAALRQTLRSALVSGCANNDAKAATFCQNV